MATKYHNAAEGLENLTPFRGMAHSMHRKDGAQGVGGKDGKVKYADLGYTYDAPKAVSENRKHYPSLHVKAGKLPDLSQAKIGDTVTLKVKAKVTGARMDEEGASFDLDVREAAVG